MKRIIYILLVVFLSGMAAQAQSYKIIVNNENSVSSLTSKEVSDFFLKKKTKWSSGDKVIPVDLSSNSSVRTDFSDGVLNKSVNAVKSYWQQFVFAGKGTPPVEKKSDAEVVEYVQRNSGAIGYVSSGASTDGVKVVKVN